MDRKKRIGWSIVVAAALGSACTHMQSRPRAAIPLRLPHKPGRSAKKTPGPEHRNAAGWLLGGGAKRWIETSHTKRGILYVSSRGERVLVAGDTFKRSPFLLPRVTSGLGSGNQYGFIEPKGNIIVTRSALGPPVLQRKAPQAYFALAVAAGRKAFVELTRSLGKYHLRPGPVLRSIDFGRTWTPTATHVEGVPVDMAMNSAGQGLMLTLPQAMWRTDDDGVTWHRVASAGHGVSRLYPGKGGSLWALELDGPASLQPQGASDRVTFSESWGQPIFRTMGPPARGS